MSQRDQTALTPPQEHCALHGGDDKFGNFLTLELRRQLARLHRRLQALGYRFSNFRINLGQSAADILTVLVQLGGHIPVEAAVLCPGDLEKTRMRVNITVQPFERRNRLVAQSFINHFQRTGVIKVQDFQTKGFFGRKMAVSIWVAIASVYGCRLAQNSTVCRTAILTARLVMPLSN
jgi:hypothetical protein